MQKLKNSIIDRMIDEQLTNTEIDFMICISRYQNDLGEVQGVHYKEVSEEMGMSYQSFYDVKESLTQKGFITCRKTSRIDHDITIVNNRFMTEEDRKAGYINTNHDLFQNPKYLALKAGSKLLAMELLKMSYFNNKESRGQFHIGTKRFFEKYMKLFKVSLRVMRSYLMDLKEFFSIGIVEKMYYIRPKTLVYRKPGAKSENDNLIEHEVDVICKRNRLTQTRDKDKQDLCKLVSQYKKTAEEFGRGIFEVLTKAVMQSLQSQNVNEKTIKKREMNPKLVHKCIRAELAL